MQTQPSDFILEHKHHPSSKCAQPQYISQRVFHDKSNLSRLPFPYIHQEPIEQPPNPPKAQPKRLKKRKPVLTGIKPKVPFKPTLSYDKTPINEYLSYELSQEINFGLKEVQILANEIKQIKEDKKKQVSKKVEKKAARGVIAKKPNFGRNASAPSLPRL